MRAIGESGGNRREKLSDSSQTPSRTSKYEIGNTKEGLNGNNCYGDLCFGVFRLSVEIRSSAAGGTCVS
jgi:hypothetical protein